MRAGGTGEEWSCGEELRESFTSCCRVRICHNKRLMENVATTSLEAPKEINGWDNLGPSPR